jgi:hypothetical protein
MSGTSRTSIVDASAAHRSRDVTEMHNQVFTSDVIAAEHRRELLAEADAYRLAREARRSAEPAARPARRFRLALPRVSRPREAT